jgi:hypothetical protein
MSTIDHRIQQAARLGVVSRARLLAVGLTDDDIKLRLGRGTLRRLHPGVYAANGAPLGVEARLLAGCWAAGPSAVVSHRAALWIWDLTDVDPPVEITVQRRRHPDPAHVVVHRPRLLRPVDTTVRKLIPVTTPMRALLDAGAVLPRESVADCVERALMVRLVSVTGLGQILDELGGPGRTGTGHLRWALDQRALGDRRPESLLEPLMARLLDGTLGIGPVDYQPTLVLEGRRVRPDFLVRLARVVVEVDGLDTHSSRNALDRDLERQNLLVSNGYQVLRYTATHLRTPARVALEIGSVCRRRMEELGVPAA